MHKAIHITHYISVCIFLAIYFVKTILLISNKEDTLTKFSKKIKIPEMIVSFLFLATGIYLLIQLQEIKMLLIIKIALVFLSIPIAVIGFKKRNKILGALSLLMITASFGLAEIAAKQTAKISKEAVAEDGTIKGAVLYQDNCVLCHGDNGKLGMSGAADISKTQMSQDSIRQVVLNGKGMMAKIQGLTPEQAAAIAAYVNTSIKGK
ncbi:MAG: c-type cytochrome [Bacteroidetes bacterium]|jgi:mono/diheme cytochrome c family protein|nr:c-type cytochrome [Bacteroidota bacterium]